MTDGEHRPTVLVVDDHRFSRTVLTRILSAAGYRIATAENGAEALASLQSMDPDAFILDAEMPGMDGIELCVRLREDPRFHVTPILISTATEDRYLLRSAFSAGCDDFLLKPLEPLVVVARLGGLLKKADYYRQLERIRSDLARYVSPRIRALIERRVRQRDSAPAPEERDVVVLFSDIRGFTSLARSLPPTVLFDAVSRHLGIQVETVYEYHGYVDKFGGDGLMAVFDGPTMAVDACRCAQDLLRRTAALPAVGGVGPVPMGVGIHAGPVVVGNIGAGVHLDYTAIGDTVNIAARLCGRAEPMTAVVSDAVHAAAAGQSRELAFGPARQATIRGLDEPVTLYYLRCPKAA